MSEIVHKAPPHKPRWITNKSESVFGLNSIHAVLECKVCDVRRPPQVFHNSDFKITGDKIKTYLLLEGL